MICADYAGACQASGEVVCSLCGQGFCWDHILTLRFASEEEVIRERSACRSCTERLFDEIEEDRLQCRREFYALERDVAALKKQLEQGPQTTPD